MLAHNRKIVIDDAVTVHHVIGKDGSVLCPAWKPTSQEQYKSSFTDYVGV
jgi:hypothetical protein